MAIITYQGEDRFVDRLTSKAARKSAPSSGGVAAPDTPEAEENTNAKFEYELWESSDEGSAAEQETQAQQ